MDDNTVLNLGYHHARATSGQAKGSGISPEFVTDQHLTSAVVAHGCKEPKKQFCSEKDQVDSAAEVLQSSALSANAELIRVCTYVTLRRTWVATHVRLVSWMSQRCNPEAILLNAFKAFTKACIALPDKLSALQTHSTRPRQLNCCLYTANAVLPCANNIQRGDLCRGASLLHAPS